jgi:predicted nucleic-acid-binding Zn-ribbon protein
MRISDFCPECESANLHTTEVYSGAHHSAQFLPGLGGYLNPAKFQVVLCGDCGLTRFFAKPQALEKLPRAPRLWRKWSQRSSVA